MANVKSNSNVKLFNIVNSNIFNILASNVNISGFDSDFSNSSYYSNIFYGGISGSSGNGAIKISQYVDNISITNTNIKTKGDNANGIINLGNITNLSNIKISTEGNFSNGISYNGYYNNYYGPFVINTISFFGSNMVSITNQVSSVSNYCRVSPIIIIKPQILQYLT